MPLIMLLNITKIKAAIPTLKPDGETLFLIYAEIFEAMVRLGIGEQLIYMTNQETLLAPHFRSLNERRKLIKNTTACHLTDS
jgi:hypothetical protein